jgi:hypothetical protein
MTPSEYKKRIENELINDFIRKFTEKVGYTPIVITDKGSNETNYNVLTLTELEECFDDFLPVIRNKTTNLKAHCRVRELKDLRHTFCFIAKLMKHTYVSIGRHINRDHTTVINSIRTFRNLYQTDEVFRMRYFNIINHIKSKHESPIMENLDKV